MIRSRNLGLLFSLVLVLSACVVMTVAQKTPSGISFSHTLHIQGVEMSCDTCHPQAQASAMASDRLLPVKSACAECHDVTSECASCHPNSDPAKIQPLPQPVTGIIFSHSQHSSLGETCDQCHVGVIKSGRATDRLMPTMALCTGCHDGGQAPAGCGTCHVDLKKSGLKPKDHDALWKEAHGLPARGRETECYQCHDMSQCSGCHEGRIETEVHPRGFRFFHGVEVTTDPQRCKACHGKQYCLRCHGRGI